MAQTLFVDVYVDNIENNPQCFHGPTLLFKRRGNHKGQFYACAACRSRKDCSFYLKASEVTIGQPSKSLDAISRRSECIKGIRLKKLAVTRKKMTKLPPSERCYCHTCSILLNSSLVTSHRNCNVVTGITDRQLKHPTEICLPRDNDKKEAQYFFSDDTTSSIVTMLKALRISKYICMGTPRLHERLINQSEKSILLDIDPKYYNFYSSKRFIWYNMFNNFTMDERRLETMSCYLKCEENIVILMDPPFGGRVEPLASTLHAINVTYNKVNNFSTFREVGVIWFFPYFMERHILQSLPNFRMLDFQVNYENHDVFNDTGSRRRKAGSPVRIFTNISLELFDMSSIPGYKFCSICTYWVSSSNIHCSSCKACTSKNGMQYVHCLKCNICVKPSYEHCETCSRCCLPSHKCGEFQPDTNCFHCHQSGHKKAQCPQLSASPTKKKRKR